MSISYTNAVPSAIADPTVDVKSLARSKASKAHKAQIAAAIVTGDLVPGRISQRQAAALVGVSISYVGLFLGRKRGTPPPPHPSLVLVATSPTVECPEAAALT